MMILGSAKVRNSIAIVAIFTAGLLVVDPGVKDTLWNMTSETMDPTSIKGDSYQTRWQLWHIAWAEDCDSAGTFLFGHGPLSTEHMDLNSKYYTGEGAKSNILKIGHTSWDNHFAANLIELGVVGLGIQLALFFAVARGLFRKWRVADPAERDLIAGIFVACGVFIFAPQLTYLFWALVGISNRITASLPMPIVELPAPTAFSHARAC
jgi:hypothetical protein